LAVGEFGNVFGRSAFKKANPAARTTRWIIATRVI
jgi:hypothetical protein